MTQAKVIESVLNIFGEFSGHQISRHKTCIYFSPNTNASLQLSISNYLGYQHVTCLGKYLGVPVLHRRSLRTDYNFILEKLRDRLNGWASTMTEHLKHKLFTGASLGLSATIVTSRHLLANQYNSLQ
ncbi:hypothetical protein V6N11_025076 [Hibiscus sabdariffa]|uniref:Reverse transcriptase n=1 Tax=Hibiscus sabdariffa TaxID=183260 RepID=A0ABR2QNY7_9ROSI